VALRGSSQVGHFATGGDQRGLLLVDDHCAVLAHLARAGQHGLEPAGLDERGAVEIGDHRPAVKQLVLAIGEDGQVRVEQIQVVDPVIHPVALAEGCLEGCLGLGQNVPDELLRRDGEPHLPIGDALQQPARGERLGQQRAQRLRPVNQGQEAGLPAGRHGEAAAVDHERVVAIGLDQPQEGQHVEIADGRVQQHVAAPVLGDIAVVGVALGVKFGRQVERVVVSLQVAMFATVEVVDLPVELHRPAAAQRVVQQALAAVGVEAGNGGLRGNGPGELECQGLRLCALGREGGALRQARGLPVDDRNIAGVAGDCPECHGLTGRQRSRRTAHAARCSSHGDLAQGLQFGQRLRQEPVGEGERRVGPEHAGRVNEDREIGWAWSFTMRQVEVSCLDRTHLGFIADTGLHPVEWDAVFQVGH